LQGGYLLPIVAALAACSGFQVPQANRHSEAEITGELRNQAATDLGCPKRELAVRTRGRHRYTVRACGELTTYCCFERAFDVLCERADPSEPDCHDEELEPVPELDMACDPTPEECGRLPNAYPP
jgi:hypothetical protein